MSNAANEEQQNRLKSRENYDLQVLVQSAAAVLDTHAGRIWTNFILENVCRMSIDPFSPDEKIMSYNCGAQAVGREIRHFITERVGLQYLKKLNDQRFDDLSDKKAIRELTDG